MAEAVRKEKRKKKIKHKNESIEDFEADDVPMPPTLEELIEGQAVATGTGSLHSSKPEQLEASADKQEDGATSAKNESTNSYKSKHLNLEVVTECQPSESERNSREKDITILNTPNENEEVAISDRDEQSSLISDVDIDKIAQSADNIALEKENAVTLEDKVTDTLKEEVSDTLKEEVSDTLKEEVSDTLKEEVSDTLKEEVADTRKEGVAVGHATSKPELVKDDVSIKGSVQDTQHKKMYPDLSAQIQALKTQQMQEETTSVASQISNSATCDDRVKPSVPTEEEIRDDTKSATQAAMRQWEPDVQPLTEQQLNSLYYNYKLEHNKTFIERFVQTELQRENHEFYEILMSYQRARKNLLLCEAALKSLQEKYEELRQEVWVTEEITVTAKGVCGDGTKCSATYTYNQAHLNPPSLENLKKNLEEIQTQIADSLSLHSYSVQLSKLQVESYIHNLMDSSPLLRDIPRNLPVAASDDTSRDAQHERNKLKTCISIIFSFHRLPITDEHLLFSLQDWTQQLVSTLLRVATFEDHLFILNQILRCPAGVGNWAALFVQVPPIPSNLDHTPLMFGNAHLDHLMTALSTILLPASGRNQFLCHLQKVFTPGSDTKGINWVMVDSDGEEDEDPQNAWLFLHENDIVALLKQFPLSAIFSHIMFIEQHPYQDSFNYDISRTTESCMYRLFAFTTCLVRILGEGLMTYNMARYRQLNKRLGRMIRYSVQFVSDHWENFQNASQGVLSGSHLYKLQVEYDAFFLRSVNLIHKSQRFGSWQFIADMPFAQISKDTLWRLLWLLYQDQGQSFELSEMPSAQQCIDYIRDPSSRVQLCDLLQHVAPSEAIYLLNTMTNMTQSCSSADVAFIETVTQAVFEASLINTETRDNCSKIGRELLASIVKCHPFMLSFITQKVHEYMATVGQMGLYLYKGLPLDSWIPSDPDLLILRQWLLNSDLGSPSNLLAQRILDNINWRTGIRADRLTVPWRVHKQVAVLVVEAYHKFVLHKNLGSLIMEGVKQMSAAVQLQQTVEQEFNSWCWNLLLRLSLHRSCLPLDDLRLVESQGQAPDVTKDDALMPLLKGIQEKNPAASYVTLILTNYGHNISHIISDGLSLLLVIANYGHLKATLYVIHALVPLFSDVPNYLINSISFRESLLLVLHADDSYFKVVQGLLSYDFPGPITKLLISMIQAQISSVWHPNKDRMVPILSLWMQLLMGVPKWHLDRNCCCVLDHLVHVALTHPPAVDTVRKILQDNFKKYCQEDKNHGMMSSIMNWVTSGVSLPSFLEGMSAPDFPWLAYMLLCVEQQWELDTSLWACIQEELLDNPKAVIDQALKKATARLKLEQAPSYSALSIYKLAQQGLDIPLGHPTSVLIWQKFFLLFLGRLTTNMNLPQKGGVGLKVFSGMKYSSMLKKMKKKLGETADHYLKLSSDVGTSEETDGCPRPGDRDMLYSLARMFQTFQLWVDEPMLQDPSLYLPSLPAQYMADRLLTLMQHKQAPWFELLSIAQEQKSVDSVSKDWMQALGSIPTAKPSGAKNETKHISATERILSRLERLESPLPPPPVMPIKSPVPQISSSLMEDRGAILHLLQSDLDILKHFSEQFCVRVNAHESLDFSYLKMVPKLYQNVSKQVTVALKCTSYVNPLHRCYKPGSTNIQTEEKWNDPIVQRQADENRADYKQVIVETSQPPPQNIVICAVHTENAITMLVKLFRSGTDDERHKYLNTIGCSLFFQLSDLFTDNVRKYPPTNQFFSSCIDVLGKEFIQQDPRQTDQVLKLTLDRPELAGLLSPHFLPSLAHNKFVAMYAQLVKTLQSGGLELTFMLLTKFDVCQWLEEYQPSKQEVKQFVELMSQAFISCGAHPEGQDRLVFHQYLGHESRLLKHKFPLYLHEVMAAILHGSSIQKVCVDCWHTLHEHCFYGNKDTEADNLTNPDVFTQMSTEQTKNLLGWLGHEFLKFRMNQKEATTFGLYPKWQMYVSEIARFLQDLSKCLIQKVVPNLQDSPSADGFDSMWRLITEAFAPWLQPLYNKDTVSMPWIEADRPLSSLMVKALVQVVGYAHTVTGDLRGRYYNDFLSLLWMYFSTVVCKADVTADVVLVFNMELTALPWQQLMPNIHVMETMTQLKEYGNSLGFNLVADVVAMIRWDQVWAWYDGGHDLELKVRFQGCLFLLLIQAFCEKKHLENPDIEQVFRQAETYRWQHLSPEAFKKACSLFLLSCDPHSLLQERTAPTAIGLRLLKSASGFSTERSSSLSEEWILKRVIYLHAVSSLVCQCCYLADWDPAAVTTVIINLLTEIETVASAVPDPYTQRAECIDFMKEILCLLNNCNPSNSSCSVVMETIRQWLEDSPQTILLLPCICAATRNLASMTQMVQVVELCIQLLFVTDVPATTYSKNHWEEILSSIQIPELNMTQFLDTCMQEMSYLLIYCFTLQKIPLCQSLEEELGVVQMILDWTSKVKPSMESESKLLLWWHKLLELILRQLDYGTTMTTCVGLLRRYIHALHLQGEDKTTVGLLGAIGLGKKSKLSEEFRVCCRAISAFCSLQILGDSELRLDTSFPPSTLTSAKQDLHSLISLKSSKKYQPIKAHIERTCDFVTDQSKTMKDVLPLIAMLRDSFYPTKRYLAVICVNK